MSEHVDKKIERDELRELFGEQLPIEAVNLIWNCEPGKTVAEARAELRALAARLMTPSVRGITTTLRGLLASLDAWTEALETDAVLDLTVRDIAEINGESVIEAIQDAARFLREIEPALLSAAEAAQAARADALEEAAKVADAERIALKVNARDFRDQGDARNEYICSCEANTAARIASTIRDLSHFAAIGAEQAGALEAAARWHDAEIAKIEEQIVANNEYRQRSESKRTCDAANEYCRDCIRHHQISASAIRALGKETGQ